MKKIIRYNKLIRDKIPEIIKVSGWVPVVKKLNKKRYQAELKKKILEEAKELIGARSKEDVINEIVDIQEILDAIMEELGLTKLQIKKEQVVKNKKRGAFRKKLFLIQNER